MNPSTIEWQYKPLGDICNIVGGGTPSKKNESFFQGNIPWATVRDMNQNIITETSFKITEDAVKNSSTNIIKAGNVVIATRVGLGKICLIDQDTAINQDLRGIIPKRKDTISVLFLFWWLKSIAHIIEQEGTGATVKGVKLPFVKSLRVPLPPLPEQQRIDSILDEVFEGIGKAIANVERNLENSRELFESCLLDALTPLNGDWKNKTLKDISIDFGRGKSKHRPRNDKSLYGGSYPFIQTGDVRNCEHRITSYTQTYNEKGLAQSKMWPKGTICITIAANIAETGILDFEACFPDSIIGIVVDKKQSSNSFVEYLLQSVKTRIQAKGKGSAQDNINLGTFKEEYFPFPSLAEQNHIVNKLDAISENIQNLQTIYHQKLNALEELKQSILQKAFTGELTAKTVDKIMEPVPA